MRRMQAKEKDIVIGVPERDELPSQLLGGTGRNGEKITGEDAGGLNSKFNKGFINGRVPS